MTKTAKKTAVKKTKSPKDRGAIGQETSPVASVEYVTRKSFEAQVTDMSDAMDNRFSHQNEKLENRTQYQGWLVSPHLYKRVLAIVGHVMLFNLAIYIPIMLLILILG
jgi:hypothetical protein